MPVDIIVGLQWGSEGKGKVAAMQAGAYQAAVRSGGPNSGHTMWHEGERYVTRHVPSAWMNSEAALYLSAGASIDPTILTRELNQFPDIYRVAQRLAVDRNAVVITQAEIASEITLAREISSTAHGVGAAYTTKLARDFGRPCLVSQRGSREVLEVGPYKLRITDVSHEVNERLAHGQFVMLEGTQGSLLSIDHGDWPYVTSRNAIAAGLLADAGIGPREVRAVLGVARTFPIRVGGPSGPLPGEITWDELSRELGRVIVPERTTVTGKVRRVARMSWDKLAYASRLNGCTGLWLSFCDYLGDIRSVSDVPREFLLSCSAHANAAVRGVSWGPTPAEAAWM